MTSDQPYLRVKNWDRYQGRRDRPSAPWFKLFTCLFEDDRVYHLTREQQILLIYYWTLAARHDPPGYLPNDPDYLLDRVRSMSRQRHRRDHFTANSAQLRATGFLVPCASPGNSVTTLSPEREREIEIRETPTPIPPPPLKKKSKPAPKKSIATETIPGLDLEAWAEYVQHRKDIRKPMSARAASMAMRELVKLGADEPQSVVVERTVVNRWTGLFGRSKGNGAASYPRRMTQDEILARMRSKRAAKGETFDV